ncbi:hypothetical protein K438DRAFT_1766867 [Mycena galopus ATCC 62051]|nr:hypothetical protein K438DRAFT_1766867 [Mycena galopus ATCC 62051]
MPSSTIWSYRRSWNPDVSRFPPVKIWTNIGDSENVGSHHTNTDEPAKQGIYSDAWSFVISANVARMRFSGRHQFSGDEREIWGPMRVLQGEDAFDEDFQQPREEHEIKTVNDERYWTLARKQAEESNGFRTGISSLSIVPGVAMFQELHSLANLEVRGSENGGAGNINLRRVSKQVGGKYFSSGLRRFQLFQHLKMWLPRNVIRKASGADLAGKNLASVRGILLWVGLYSFMTTKEEPWEPGYVGSAQRFEPNFASLAILSRKLVPTEVLGAVHWKAP